MSQAKKVFEFGPNVMGSGKIIFAFSHDCNFLVTAGENMSVCLFDRRGKKLHQFTLPERGRVEQIEWDKDNEVATILQTNLTSVLLFNVITLQTSPIDIGKDKTTFIRWSKTHPILAIGTDKGGVIFFNRKNSKKLPTTVAHSKKVITGDWNKMGNLMTGAEDKVLSFSNQNGETAFESVGLKAVPKNVKWARQKTDSRDTRDNTICALLNQKTILMFEIEANKQPLELVFEPRYGSILEYEFYGDGYMVVGFTEGYLTHISTHMKEMNSELSSDRVFNTKLEALCVNDSLYKVACAGERMIKVLNMQNWQEIRSERIDLPPNVGTVSKLFWSLNGQLLVASTDSGYVLGFMTSVPSLTATHGTQVALLSGFTDVSIGQLNPNFGMQIQTSIKLDLEPGFISLGPSHFVAGMNNIMYLYAIRDPASMSILPNGHFLYKTDFNSSIKYVRVNSSFIAALMEGRCILQTIVANGSIQPEEWVFPSTPSEKAISMVHLTANFLIMVDTGGKIIIHQLIDHVMILEYKPDFIPTKVYPNPNGTKLILVDSSDKGYLFICSTEQLVEIQDYPLRTDQLLWDQEDPSIFVVWENDNMHTMIIQRNHYTGVRCKSVKEIWSLNEVMTSKTKSVTTIERGVLPLVLLNGTLMCQGSNGGIIRSDLKSHNFESYRKAKGNKEELANISQEDFLRLFMRHIALNRFNECLFIAKHLRDIPEIFESLGKCCLEFMEFEVASRCFQSIQNLSLVYSVAPLKSETEKNIISGNIALILSQYQLAEEFFLKSSRKGLALDLRCDIQDWIPALNLAREIDPSQEKFISRRLAAQVESQSNNSEALKLYEKAIIELNSAEKLPKEKEQQIKAHNTSCMAGLARTCIKTGNIQRGMQISQGINDSQLLVEIGITCENYKQLYEAAQLYQRAELFEKAATLYIQLKMFKAAAQLISKIKSPKLLSMLANAKIAEGNYKEAEEAFEKSENWEKVIKLNIENLNNYEKAYKVFKEKCQTPTCATMMAAYCEKKGMKKEAVEFMVLAGKKDEAFDLACSLNHMEAYQGALKDLSVEECRKIAGWYEGQDKYADAAKLYRRIGNITMAFKYYLQGGEVYLDDMIDMVVQNPTDNLVNSLRQYIQGEVDHNPKDPKYLFKLFLKIGKIKEAATLAIRISDADQKVGEYASAQNLIFSFTKQIRESKIKVAYELYNRLVILHSYNLVKRMIKMEMHLEAARLLNRVCKSISLFPKHAVTILTTAVIENTKAGLRASAFTWSAQLCLPEYRNSINPKNKDKIENIARKPVRTETEQTKTPCPFCTGYVDEFELNCESCKSNIPFCVASGKHMIKSEVAKCPSCEFPALMSYFQKVLQQDPTCPMCNSKVSPDQLAVTLSLIHSKLFGTNSMEADGPKCSELLKIKENRRGS